MSVTYDDTLTNSEIYSRNILLYYGICRSSSHITASAVLLLALKLCTSGLTNWCHLDTTRCWNLPQRDIYRNVTFTAT